ncbi:MAG: tRNA (cytidine(34)-2'-O)-methyltransferase [Lentisphaeria bacterium]|nr:tRNA (cytidine(34)-2'-O)-methyltransferase [Lentisphaeria bacterium]
MSKVDFKIVLFQPEIPHNTGAIGRICVNLGVPLHLIKPLGFSLNEHSVKRAGLDYWPYLDLHIHENWEDFLDQEEPKRLFFSSTRGKKTVFEMLFENGDYLVFGRETSGLPEDFYTIYKENLFLLPMPGEHARSLNLATAAAVVAYEAYRQIS